MKRKEIEKRLTDIYREVFEDDTIELHDSMTSDDIEEWDSLTHLSLIMQIEKAFAIKFTTVQIKNMVNVGELIDAIEAANIKKEGIRLNE